MTRTPQQSGNDRAHVDEPEAPWALEARLLAALLIGAGPPLYRNWVGSGQWLTAIVLIVGSVASISLSRSKRDWSVFPLAALGALAMSAVVAAVLGLGFRFAVAIGGTQLAVGALVAWPPTSREQYPKISPLGLAPLLLAMWGWSRGPEATRFLIAIAFSIVGLEIHRRWPGVIRSLCARLTYPLDWVASRRSTRARSTRARSTRARSTRARGSGPRWQPVEPTTHSHDRLPFSDKR